MRKAIVLALWAAVLACGGSKNAQPSGGGGGGGGNETCLGSGLLTALGRDHLLVGMAGSDTAAEAGPYDLRYQYISSGAAPGPSACSSCSNTGCGAWWGCGWQDMSAPPGGFVTGYIQGAQQKNEIPMFTHYEWLPTVGWGLEGQGEVDALQNAASLGKYLDDWRFFLQKVGSEVTLLHIEPDFWAYAQHANADAHAVPAAVTAANSTDCGAMENSVAGLGRCMIAMARTYAPNAKVGLHASGWATGTDVLNSSDAGLDVVGEANKLGAFLNACGADQADFVVADMSDRDAAYYEIVKSDPSRWWDATNATLPNFHRAFAWSSAVAEAVGKPILWWQTPVGNMSLANTDQHYKDNRLEYVFAHWDEVAASHAIGVAFGAGNGNTTTPDTDGGLLAAKTAAYIGAGGQALCQ